MTPRASNSIGFTHPLQGLELRLRRHISLHFVLHLRISVSLGTGWTAEPLIVATARDRQKLTQATHLELGLLLVYSGVLHSSCGVKYAAAAGKLCAVVGSQWPVYALQPHIR